MTHRLFGTGTSSTLRAMAAATAILLASSIGAGPAFAGSADTSNGSSTAARPGIWLAACKPPPLPTEGCVKNPCDGKYICCTSTSGMTKCRTMNPPKPKK